MALAAACWVGGMPAKERRAALAKIAAGEWKAVIGTHALISEGVRYQRLGLCITDEQHRFGVAQRTVLLNKGAEGERAPHLLVMSATPIPRSLALVMFGDLDLSIIDELPPGRQPVTTRIVSEEKREAMYGFLRKELEAGRQAYVVCPLVEESENADSLKAARRMRWSCKAGRCAACAWASPMAASQPQKRRKRWKPLLPERWMYLWPPR